MEALALLNTSNSNHSCGSVAELQNQLRDLFSTKVTEKRANHISVKFDLRPTIVFHVPVTETENDTLEATPHIPGLVNQPTRQINAIDALVNQPSDDHALQKSVAKHIVSSLGEVDGSSWTVRQVSRNEQGWTFTYICKDSLQAWTRQNAKTPPKTIIGEWSNKEGQDPIHLTRPAFDCQGSVTIAFVKSSRSITVKYDHMPMHKTVGELVDFLVPPVPIPPPVRPPWLAKKAQKAPKEPKEPRAPRPKKLKTPKPPGDLGAIHESSRKKRRAEDGALDGEKSTPKKRKSKKDSAAHAGTNGHMIPLEMLGVLPIGDSAERSYYSNGDEVGAQQNGYSAYPEGLVGSSTANGNNSRSDSQVSANAGVHSHSVLNLPPGEAARRRDVAIKLLTEKNIDPQTLSPEQFNILANQSPDLQRESLAMLEKYGAERLRIVHPTKDGASSGQSTPQVQPSGTESAESTSPSKSKKSRKKKSDASQLKAPEETQAESDSGKANSRKRQTRGACQSCRSSKAKCDKIKPSCSQCLASGITCNYPLAKPRASRTSNVNQEEDEEAEEAEAAPAAPTVMEIDDELEDLGSPGFHQPDPAPEPSTLVAPSPDVYENHSDFPFPESHDVHSGITPAAMDYMPTPATDTSLHNYTYPAPTPQAPLQAAEPPTTIQPDNMVSTRSKARRSLPSGPPAQVSPTGITLTGQASSWQTMNQAAVAPAPTRTSPRQSRPRKPVSNQSQSSTQPTVSQAYDDIRQNQSWTPIPPPTIPPSAPSSIQTQQTTSPYQAAAQLSRAKSRQSNRGQTRTPVQNISAVRPSQPQTGKPMAESAGYGSNAAVTDANQTAGYDGYSQYTNARADPSNSRVGAYDQYSTNPSSTVSNSYCSYDTYNTRPSNTTSSTGLANPVPQQTTAASYGDQTASATPSTSHWGTGGTSSAVSQSRNAQSFNTNTQASSAGRPSTYGLAAPAAAQPRSQTLQGFNVRPQPTAPQTRSPSASTYNQQPQQTSQRQGYNSYPSQQAHGGGNPSTTQHHQQQNWYGFSAANNSSSGYNSSAPPQHTSTGGSGGSSGHPNSHPHGGGGGGSSSYGQQQPQHHRSMNLSSHTYSSIDGGDHALYEMLRNNQS